MGQHATGEVLAEIPLHEPGHPRLVELALALERQRGLEVLAHHRLQHRALGALLLPEDRGGGLGAQAEKDVLHPLERGGGALELRGHPGEGVGPAALSVACSVAQSGSVRVLLIATLF